MLTNQIKRTLLFINNFLEKNIAISFLFFGSLSILSVFYGVNSSFDTIISIAWVIYFLLNAFKKEKYLILGFLTVFQTRFTIFGLSAFKLLIILFVFTELLTINRQKLFLTIPSIVFCVLLLIFGMYIYVAQGLGLSFLIPYICSCLVIMILINQFNLSIECFKKFAFGFITAFLVCSFSGVFLILVGRGNISSVVVRFKGTMDDPNYYSMHGMISLIFSYFLIKNKRTKFLVSLLILIFCSLSASTNFFFCLALCLVGVFYINSKKKVGGTENLLFDAFYILLFGLVLILLVYVSNILGVIVYKFPNSNSGLMKLARQFYALQIGDFTTFSSYRVDIWNSYLDYFTHQNPIKICFGGNLSSTYGVANFIDSNIANRASHNTFIDILMCLGVFGFTVFLLSFILSLRKTNKILSKQYKHIFILSKIVVLIYFFGLSCFPSWFLLFIILV